MTPDWEERAAEEEVMSEAEIDELTKRADEAGI
jgi:hypothetical protein